MFRVVNCVSCAHLYRSMPAKQAWGELPIALCHVVPSSPSTYRGRASRQASLRRRAPNSRVKMVRSEGAIASFDPSFQRSPTGG